MKTSICVHIRFSRGDVSDPLTFYKPEDSSELRLAIMNFEALLIKTENGIIESPLGDVKEIDIHQRMQRSLQLELN